MSRHTVLLHANDLTFTAFSSFAQDQWQSQTPERIIFLLHGFPDTHHSFDTVWPIIEEKYPSSSNLILAPRMRGYEPSSVLEDRGEYSIRNIGLDVIGWTKEIIGDRPNIPVHIIGHDWGALAAFSAAGLAPELITSISTLAIPYLANVAEWELLWNCPSQLYLSSYMIRMQTSYFYGKKLYPNNLVTVLDSGDEYNILPYIEQLWRYWSPGWKFTTKDLAQFCDAFKEPGVVDCTTGYYYSMFKNRKHGKDWVVDFNKVPTLLVGGRDDGCMLYTLYDLEAKRLSVYGEDRAKVVQVEKVGHFMHRENPRKIAELCIDWIEKHE